MKITVHLRHIKNADKMKISVHLDLMDNLEKMKIAIHLYHIKNVNKMKMKITGGRKSHDTLLCNHYTIQQQTFLSPEGYYFNKM
jgi:hypothetical protein